MSDRSHPRLITSPSFQTKQSQETQNILRMIQILKNYEDNCLTKGNFFEAEVSRLRIGDLKQQQLKFQHQELNLKNKENIQRVQRKNQQEVALFHLTWEQKIKQNLEAYKLLQQKLKEDQQRELEQFKLKIFQCKPPKIKYSSEILRTRNHLQNLIKGRDYLQAQRATKWLQQNEQKQNQRWIQKFQDKKKKQIQKVIKHQQIETSALKIKIKTMLNQKIKEKQQLFSKLLKKINKRNVQCGKCPIELKLKEQKLLKTSVNMSRSSSKDKRSLFSSRSKCFSTKDYLNGTSFFDI